MKRNRAERFEAARVILDNLRVPLGSSTAPKTANKGQEKPILQQIFPDLDTLDAVDLSLPGLLYASNSSEENLNDFTQGLSKFFKERGINTKKKVDAIIDQLEIPMGFTDGQVQAIKDELGKIMGFNDVPVKENKNELSRIKEKTDELSSNLGSKALATA